MSAEVLAEYTSPAQQAAKLDPNWWGPRLKDQVWRLNNLYRIVDKSGREVVMRLNWVQQELLHDLWSLNVILKSRRHGVSTFILVFILDNLLFHKNLRSGVVADNQDHAKELFRNAVKFPYEKLPRGVMPFVPAATTKPKQQLVFDNNSSIQVATSMRSGTLNFLHVSEFGKICAKYPETAREIVTGSFEAVHAGQCIFVESTAEGRGGTFYDLSESSRILKETKAVETYNPLDWMFHFFPWWRDPENRLNDPTIVLYPAQTKYFKELKAKHGIDLDRDQKCWYTAKQRQLGGDMFREHPSIAEEAFLATIQGAYYREEFHFLRQNDRIREVPHQPSAYVDTWWDLGVDDETAIWMTQDIGREVHVINFYKNKDEGLRHYADYLDALARDEKYRFRWHTGPHDLKQREFGTGKSVLEQAKEFGLNFRVAPMLTVLDGIQACRRMFELCWFDKARCDEPGTDDDAVPKSGLAALEQYQKEWDAQRATYKPNPLHNWASHPADAFRTMGVVHRFATHTTTTSSPEQRRGAVRRQKAWY